MAWNAGSHTHCHVGVCELLGFDERVQRLSRVVTVPADRRALHQIEHHQRRDALSVRRQLVDRPSAIRRRERRHPLGIKRREIVCGQHPALRLGALHDALRDLAAIERVASARAERTIGRREIGVFENLPHRRHVAARQIHTRGLCVRPQERLTSLPFGRDDLGNRETPRGNFDRGRQYVRQR